MMKKLLAVFLILALLLPVAAFSDPGVALCYRMNFYAAAYNELYPGSFDFDTMIIDLYFMDDFQTAYYCKTIWSDGSIDTTGYVQCTVSAKDPDGKRHLLFPTGEQMTFDYDDDGAFWLEMENGTYHLLPCEQFNLKKDLKG